MTTSTQCDLLSKAPRGLIIRVISYTIAHNCSPERIKQCEKRDVLKVGAADWQAPPMPGLKSYDNDTTRLLHQRRSKEGTNHEQTAVRFVKPVQLSVNFTDRLSRQAWGAKGSTSSDWCADACLFDKERYLLYSPTAFRCMEETI